MAEKEPENLEETQPTTEPAATPPPSEDLQQFSKWMIKLKLKNNGLVVQ